MLLRKKKVWRLGMSSLFLTRVINSIFLSEVGCWAQVVCLHLFHGSAPYTFCSGCSELLWFLGLLPNDAMVGFQYASDPLLQCQDINFSQASPRQQVLLGNSVLEGHNYLQDIKLLTGYQRWLTSELLKYDLPGKGRSVRDCLDWIGLWAYPGDCLDYFNWAEKTHSLCAAPFPRCGSLAV